MIDSNETIMYENGRDLGYEEGFDDCKESLMDVIETLAYDIARYKYPGQYDYSDEQIENIMLAAGLNRKYLEE